MTDEYQICQNVYEVGWSLATVLLLTGRQSIDARKTKLQKLQQSRRAIRATGTKHVDLFTNSSRGGEGGGGNHIVEKCWTGIVQQGRLGEGGGIPLLAQLLAQQFAPKNSLFPQLEGGGGGRGGREVYQAKKV